MPKNSRLVLSLLFMGLMLVLPSYAKAAGKNTGGGISLSPFVQQIAIQPNDAARSYSLVLTNHTDTLQELNLASHDFGSLNDTGGVLLEGSNSFTGKYGLTSWLRLEADTVVLQPKESRAVLVTIDNRSSLQPGGHYGAVVASVSSLSDQTGNHVVVNQQLLSLILVDKVGGEHYDLKLDSVNQNGNWLHLPNDIRLRFQNPGNVHVVPRGIVTLKSPGGRVLAQGIINNESAYILPESFRELFVRLTPVASTVPVPGIYHIQVDYRYDGILRTVSKSYAVRYANAGVYLLAAFLVAIVGFFIWHQKNRPKISETTE